MWQGLPFGTWTERPFEPLHACRRALLELHALPPGSLPDELEDLIEDLIAPGFRERLQAAFLETCRHQNGCSSFEAQRLSECCPNAGWTGGTPGTKDAAITPQKCLGRLRRVLDCRPRPGFDSHPLPPHANGTYRVECQGIHSVRTPRLFHAEKSSHPTVRSLFATSAPRYAGIGLTGESRTAGTGRTERPRRRGKAPRSKARRATPA